MFATPKLTRAVLYTFLTAIFASPALATEQLPEVDSDGLHLVKGSEARVAYRRPGADLAQFDKVMILDCYVEFKEHWEKDYNLNQVGLSGRVTHKDVARIKDNLAAEFKKVFTSELTKGGHPVVNEPGPGVLLLRPAIINLDVAAPDIMRASRGNTWVSSAGEMTLYLEVYDASSSELLARIIDPQADIEATAKPADTVTNKAAADRILRRWASRLSDHLSEAQSAAR